MLSTIQSYDANGRKLKKIWITLVCILVLHVRAILGKKAAQLPTRASGGAKNTKLDLLLGGLYASFVELSISDSLYVCHVGTLNQIVVKKVPKLATGTG